MGLLRKKDKRNKHSREQGLAPSDTDTAGRFHQNTTSYESKEVDRADSALSPAYSDPYSPTGTDNSSMSGDSKTIGQEASRRNRRRDDSKGPWFTSRQIRLFRKPPPAEQAAYSGPPRYDWVDIETAAAIKIQAAYRRRRIMGMMEEEGQTTAAVRNMARRRQAAKEASTNPAQDFIDLFNCCGVDLGLGAGNKEAYFDYTRELETAKYNETRRETAEREELLRKKYQRKPPRESLVENVEVVQ